MGVNSIGKCFLIYIFVLIFLNKRLLSLNIKFIYAFLYNYLHMEGHFPHEKINKSINDNKANWNFFSH